MGLEPASVRPFIAAQMDAAKAIQYRYRADWLVLDGDDPYLAAAPDASILNRWLFAGGKEQIRDVFVGGRQVIEQGRHALQQQSGAEFLQVLKTFQQEA